MWFIFSSGRVVVPNNRRTLLIRLFLNPRNYSGVAGRACNTSQRDSQPVCLGAVPGGDSSPPSVSHVPERNASPPERDASPRSGDRVRRRDGSRGHVRKRDGSAAGIVRGAEPPGAQPDLYPTPFALHPAPNTLNSTPYTLHPSLYTLHPTLYTLQSTLYTLHSTPYTLHPTIPQ